MHKEKEEKEEDRDDVASVSRKDIAFAMRALSQANVVQFLWTCVSWHDRENETFLISKRDADARNMSPIDTLRVAESDVEKRCKEHSSLFLHKKLHEISQSRCCILVHNLNASWISTRGVDGSLPAYDCNCAMFAPSNSIARISAPYNPLGFDDEDVHSTCNADTKVAILPNRAVAVFGETIQESIMRAIYFDFAVETMRAIEGMAGNYRDERQCKPTWPDNDLSTKLPEVKAQMMHPPAWWDKVEPQSTPTAMSRTSWSFLRRKICRRTQ